MPKVAKPLHDLCPSLSMYFAQGRQAVPPPCQHLPKSPSLPTDFAHTWAPPCQHFARDSPTCAPALVHADPRTGPRPDRAGTSGRSWGRDRIGATWAESQWIVAARPLCHLQYPVAYLSRLQRILPAARREFLQGVPYGSSAAGVSPTTRAFGGRGPYCWSANGRRAHASLLARILT